MNYETNTETKHPTVNSLNFVVDSLLHALQVVRYSWSMHREARSLWDMAVCAMLKTLLYFVLNTYIGFYIYASAKHLTMFLELKHLSYCVVEFQLLLDMFNMIGGLILVSHASKRWYSARGFWGCDSRNV